MEIRFEKKKKLPNEAVSIEKYRTESSHMTNKKVTIVIKNSMWLYNYIIRFAKCVCNWVHWEKLEAFTESACVLVIMEVCAHVK